MAEKVSDLDDALVHRRIVQTSGAEISPVFHYKRLFVVQAAVSAVSFHEASKKLINLKVWWDYLGHRWLFDLSRWRGLGGLSIGCRICDA